MNTFQYICDQNKNGSIELANKFSKSKISSPKEAYNCFIYVMQNADEATKSSLLEQIREIHPDSTLYRDESGVGFWKIKHPTEIIVEKTELINQAKEPLFNGQSMVTPLAVPMMNACGCGGHNPQMMHAIGSTDAKVAELKAEKKTQKTIFNVIVVAVLIAIVYKLFIKK